MSIMVLQGSGAISLSQIKGEMGGPTPIWLGQYLATNTTTDGVQNIPRSGAIGFGDFFSKQKFNAFSPKFWLRMEDLSAIAHGDTVSSWPGAANGKNATAYSVGTAGLPVVNRVADRWPFVRLGTNTSSNANGNYFDFGSQLFNFGSGPQAGFTAVVMARFCRQPGDYERVFDFGNGAGQDTMLIARRSTSTSFTLDHYAGTTAVYFTLGTLTGGWQIMALRIRPNEIAFFDGGSKFTTTNATFTMASNKLLTRNYIGRSNWADNAYANMDIREALFYEQALTDAQINTLRDYLYYKYPCAYVATSISWTSAFVAQQVTGTFPIAVSGVSPDVQYQLCSEGKNNNVNVVRGTWKLQAAKSFVCSFELFMKGSADTVWFFVGSATPGTSEAGKDGSYCVLFNVYPPAHTGIGVYLMSNGTVLKKGSYAVNGVWEPVEVIYTRGLVDTWKVNCNGSNVITYSDPNDSSTFAQIAGTQCGFGGRTGGLTGDFYIRRVNLCYSEYDMPPIMAGLVGYYTGESFSGTTWFDASGAGNHASTLGTINSTLNNTVNRLNGWDFLSGGTGASVTFPAAILPSTYTIFHLTTYNGGSNGRIFSSSGSATANWLSGHHWGRTGIAYHGDGTGWVTDQVNKYSGWILSSDQNASYRANKVDFTTNNAAGSATRIGINLYPNEQSDWACATAIVYNRTLSASEVDTVENWIIRKDATLAAPTLTVPAKF
ncbi:hypothetical protein COO60DRAFT_1644284 [Scenedesmus sp. NREL 46B-D3]|nr:hypothetical protein COO60DRAFT_1644284 [Scenedesmus sp. NREL 46B-D3]